MAERAPVPSPNPAERPPVRRRRPARAVKATLATFLTAALIAGLHGEAAAVSAGQLAADEKFTPRKEKSVPVTNAKPKAKTVDPAQGPPVTKTPVVQWPAAGSAEVALPQPTAAGVAWDAVLTGRPAVAALGPAARAGVLPVELGPTAAANRGAAADTPAKVKVDLLGRQGDRVLVKLSRTDGAKKAGSVSLRFDYSGFANAYGGDWNSRLRLVRLPDCAASNCQDRSEPDQEQDAAAPVATRNDGSGKLSAEVPADGLYAIQAAASGPAGDHSATSLNASASWQVGGSSGDFNWNYPMDAPPGIGGPVPQLGMSYSSGGVDGRTAASNNQPSWVGEGFEFTPGGSIERRYAGCGGKSEQSGNNGTRAVGDLCWATDNAHFTMDGKGGELVLDDATGTWHPRVEDGMKVERFYGADNGDGGQDGTAAGARGEYWVLTGKDGTKYYFGLNKLPGATTQRTNSTWTVPVFGNHGGEPCNTSSFASSHCQQAYKWNLDYVVDPHGNTMSLFYDTETNNYSRNSTATTVSTYIRAGNVSRIEYGQRDGEVFGKPAIGRVLFQTAPRCVPGTACGTADYPDTPLDQECTSTTNCGTKSNPTFWTKKRLVKVTTEVWHGTKYDPVESWSLRQSFPAPGDGTRPGLWLDGITNAGHVGGYTATPETTFAKVMLANRVAGTDGLPEMRWGRVSAVHYGTGGEIVVTYAPPDCSLPGNVPAPDTNGKRCHPVKWTPEGQAERTDWFNKYVVTGVTESDLTTGLVGVQTKVDYLSPPAWRHDDEDGLVEIGKKTWSQWRGYEKVKVTKGRPDGPQSVTVNTYFRGMDGDKLANGQVKDVHVADSTGAKVEDVNPLSGEMRETTTYDGTKILTRSVTDQWISAPTATRVRSWGTTQTFRVEEAGLRQDEALESGYRRNASAATYNAAGQLLSSADLGDASTPADDTCTRYEYAQNPGKMILELRAREHVVDVGCDQPWDSGDVITDERVFYDNATSTSTAPTKGDVTRVDRLAEFNQAGAPTYQTVLTLAYDQAGRETRMTDSLERTTSIAYIPADGAQTKAVVTQPGGHVKTTELEPAWGEETAVVDPDGRRSETKYDALGRTEKVWLPGRAGAAVPNLEYSYGLSDTGANVVTNKTLQADGSVETEWELTDGLMRPRQTQEPAPGGGRLVTDYIYDERGNLVKENGPFYNDAPPGDQVVLPNEAELPAQKLIEYNASDEPVLERIVSESRELWRTNHRHAADRHTVEPPSGEQPETKITNVDGKLVELREYHGTTAGGGYDSTKYTYHPAGQLASVVDPAGNRWQFDYDLRGRKIREIDPDKGTTTFEYDSEDQLTATVDGRGKRLAYTYDAQGRKTGLYENSPQGTKLAEWVYDTLAKGAITSSTRFVNGNPYTYRVTGYDPAARPTGYEFVIPASEGGLAGTYSFATGYHADGEVATSKLPGVGGLPEETLRHTYNSSDLPTSLVGADSYVSGTTYTPFGEVDVMTLGGGGKKWLQRKYEYELGTRRLKRVVTDRETLPRRISAVTYDYDASGNVTKIADTPSSTTGQPTDTQCFKYDIQRRMTAAWTPGSNDCAVTPSVAGLGGPAPFWHSWTFDKTGNRTSETRTTSGGSTASTYTYPAPGQARPHAVQKVTTGGTSSTYSWDESGNLASRTVAGVGETFSFDAEGHLSQVSRSGKSTSFLYDADGNRLIRRDPSGTTLYLGDTELLLTGGQVSGTRHYRLGEKTIAVRTGGTLSWLGTDHHGTADLAVDSATQTFQRRRTTPYGEARGAQPESWPGQRAFVGGTSDPSTGLVHLGAREYDPSIGRFISVDPLADYENPQQLNGYAYANNNPATYEDADGKFFWFAAILAVRLIPVVVRVVRIVPVVVRTVTPVIRTVAAQLPKVANAVHRAAAPVRQVTQMVQRAKTVMRPIVNNVRKVIPKQVRNTKPVKAKQPAKRPAAKAKTQAKKEVRNTKTAKRAQKSIKALQPKKKAPEKTHKAGQAPLQFKHHRPSPKERMRNLEERRLDDWTRLPQRPDPNKWRAEVGDRLQSPELHPDGTKIVGGEAEQSRPATRGGRATGIVVGLLRVAKWLDKAF